MSHISSQVVFEAWYSWEWDSCFGWRTIVKVFFLFIFAEDSKIVHKPLSFESMHLSGDANAARENDNLIIGEVELLCKRLLLKAFDFFLIASISWCNREYFSIIWLVHKEKSHVFEAKKRFDIHLDFSDELFVSFDFHNVECKYDYFLDLFLLDTLYDGLIMGVYVHKHEVW